MRQSRHGVILAICSALLVAGVSGSASAVGAVPRAVASDPLSSTLSCKANMSDTLPKPRSTVLVYVHSSPHVTVKTWASFKTGTVSKHGTADKFGNATLTYKLGRVAKGFTVHVRVRVTLNRMSASCVTAFTPS